MAVAGQSGANLLGSVDRAAAVQHDPITRPRERQRGRCSDSSGSAGDENPSGHSSSLSVTDRHCAFDGTLTTI